MFQIWLRVEVACRINKVLDMPFVRVYRLNHSVNILLLIEIGL
ncbi:hypothetical protein MGSAQ_000944 [marine sediment metagenome]|uniref:Uncharacterized protein n=1 Tax=marine sediment metagenome TaxID=412755 RepID=A0A1B6NVV3_9ZZZZ